MGIKEILTDDMLAAAFAFRKTELWEELDDGDIFAVRLSNGETGYCCVMGNNGEHYALGFYIGDEGFSTYLDMVHGNELPMLEMNELSMSFDCINVDFEDVDDKTSFMSEETKDVIRDFARRNKLVIPASHGWPAFTRLRPAKVPFGITDENEARFVTEALNAAVEVAKQVDECDDIEDLGFENFGEYADNDGGKEIPLLIPDGNGEYEWTTTETPEHIVPTYFAPEYNDDDRLDKLDAIKKKGMWQVKLSHVLQPIHSEGSIDYYPLCLFMVNKNTDKSLHPVMINDYNEVNLKDMLDGMADVMIENHSVPLTIEVDDPCTYGLLQDFCSQEGINLNKVHRLPNIEKLLLFVYQMIMNGGQVPNE